jgi:hypothetical protein
MSRLTHAGGFRCAAASWCYRYLTDILFLDSMSHCCNCEIWRRYLKDGDSRASLIVDHIPVAEEVAISCDGEGGN